MTGRVLLGRYELGRELGAGAMGKVFEGTDRQLERKVAIKLLLTGQHTDETRARFMREGKLLARIQNQHVVAVFDVGVTPEDDPFIVMELLLGATLRQKIVEGRRLPPRASALFARDLSRGLGALHAAGLVHRDVKPANVVVVAAGDRELAKLLDLGVARASDQVPLTQPGAVVGTALYVAPEQIRGGDVDGRADIYALGASLFELLEGRPPFVGPTVVETIHAHLYDALPRMGTHVPRSLAEIVSRCLAKRPEDRFASCSLLEAALDREIEALAAFEAASEAAAEAAPAFAPLSLPMLVLPELVGEPPAPAPPSGQGSPAADEALPPIELSIDSGSHAGPAPLLPDVDAGAEPLLDALEVNRDEPPGAAGPLARPFDMTPSYRPPAHPLALAPRTALDAPSSSPLAGLFAVFPAQLHLRVAVGAFVVAWLVLLLSGSKLLFGLCLAISVFGALGFFLRRRADGLDE